MDFFFVKSGIELPIRIFSNAVRSAMPTVSIIFNRWIFRLCLCGSCFARWALNWWYRRKISARFWLYVAIIHFHINDFHELYLRGQFLNFLLRNHNTFSVWLLGYLKTFDSIHTFNSSFSWYKSGESSGTKPIPFNENDAVMPRTLARWSHWSPWPLNTRKTFGPNTNRTVVVVLSWVRTNPKKYLTSGPACGKINKLKSKN